MPVRPFSAGSSDVGECKLTGLCGDPSTRCPPPAADPEYWSKPFAGDSGLGELE